MLLVWADSLIPMDGAVLLSEGGIVVGDSGEQRGRVVAVGTVAELRREFSGIEERHFSGVMMPGFVNAHVHLELGYQRRGGDGPVKFTEWVSGLMRNYPKAEVLEEMVVGAVRAGVKESVAAGVTCVGDISRNCGIVRRELSGGSLRSISFGEVVGLGKMRGRLERMLETAADERWASELLRIGISPHAPYTVEGPSLKRIAERAVEGKMPVAMHLAELSEEREFLETLGGALGREWDVMQKLDVIDAMIPVAAGGPVKWAQRWGLLGVEGAAREVAVVLAHVNYVEAGDLELLKESRASVAYCPRTRAFFGHDAESRHPYREMLAGGVNVCLGTDSLASNPDLSVLKEARFLFERDALLPMTAMEMITWRGAKALGIEAGRLVEGAYADFVVLPVSSHSYDSPHAVFRRVLSEAVGPEAVWIGGREVI